MLAFDPIATGSRQEERHDFYDRYPRWSLMGKMVLDSRHAIDAALANPDVDPKRISLVGFGMGGMVATLTAALDERVGAVVSVSGWTPFAPTMTPPGRAGSAAGHICMAGCRGWGHLWETRRTSRSTFPKSCRPLLHDFETLSTQNPPPGWAMWGAEQYKVPANYTRDTAQPALGRRCFRIHHPANTGGYVVLAPERAIRPETGDDLLRCLSGRERTSPARPCSSGRPTRRSALFMMRRAGLASVSTPGRSGRSSTFSVREGLDFFADQSRFLLLTFNAATDQRQERTLWIDDVRVSEQPDPNPAALLNEATIPHEPLQHRLRPGDQLEFTVDPARRLGRVATQAGGVSFHRVCGWTGQPYNRKGEYTLLPELERAIREMRLPMTRFYAVGDEPFGVESAIDKVAEVCRPSGHRAGPLRAGVRGTGRIHETPAGSLGARRQPLPGERLRVSSLGDRQRALLIPVGPWPGLPDLRRFHRAF